MPCVLYSLVVVRMHTLAHSHSPYILPPSSQSPSHTERCGVVHGFCPPHQCTRAHTHCSPFTSRVRARIMIRRLIVRGTWGCKLLLHIHAHTSVERALSARVFRLAYAGIQSQNPRVSFACHTNTHTHRTICRSARARHKLETQKRTRCARAP